MFDWITGFVAQTGYFGILFLMFAENVFPPIPSELIMPFAGFAAARGDLNFFLALLAGTAGALLGALLWYYIGRWVGEVRLKRLAVRHGRWMTLSPGDVDQASDWFDRHGATAVLIGRLIPAVRTLISVPAGIADMPLPRFLAYSTLGTAVWSGLLATAGYLLGNQYQTVAAYMNPVSNLVVGALVIGYLYRVITWRPEEAR